MNLLFLNIIKKLEGDKLNIIFYKNRKLDYNKPIKIYRNLNQEKLSVKQGNLVIGHCDYINLKDVTFHVQKYGLEKCRKEKRKNVHAYVKGYIKFDNYIPNNTLEVEYNPYKNNSFVDEYGVKIDNTNNIFINKFGVMLTY